MSLRSDITGVLDQADRIDAAWAQACEETDGSPLSTTWETDEDARRGLSYDAVEVLRHLLKLVDDGADLGLAAPAPPLIFMQWDGGPDEHPFEDQGPLGVVVDHGQIYTVCPHCEAVDGGIVEVDRCERWNEAEIDVQAATIARSGEPNPLVGLPCLSIHQDRDSDFHTDRYTCGTCQGTVDLPAWVESDWS